MISHRDLASGHRYEFGRRVLGCALLEVAEKQTGRVPVAEPYPSPGASTPNPRPSVAGGRVDIGAVENQSVAPVPTLTAISPNSGAANSTVSVTLTGTALSSATAITVSGTGVTVSGLTVVSESVL